MAGRHGQYPPELRERAVRLVAECRPDRASEWEAMRSVAQKLGIGTHGDGAQVGAPAEGDAGARPGVTSDGSAELRRLKAEVRELRRTNEILKAAAAESTGHPGSREVRGRARRPDHRRRAALGSRADLPGAQRARNADRPQHLLRPRTRRSERAVRDEQLKAQISRIGDANYGVYGARKVWLALNREGWAVARCTVERLMRDLGLEGARRGRRHRTTIADPSAVCPADLMQRRFTRHAPTRSGWPTSPTWRPGRAPSTSPSSSTATPAGSSAGGQPPRCAPTWSSTPSSRPSGPAPEKASPTCPVSCATTTPGQYTSIAFTERLAAAGAAHSVGAVGDALDNPWPSPTSAVQDRADPPPRALEERRRRRAGPSDVQRVQLPAARNCSTTSALMRPRALTSIPWPLAQARTAAGS